MLSTKWEETTCRQARENPAMISNTFHPQSPNMIINTTLFRIAATEGVREDAAK